jgi:transaldolase
MPGQTLRAFADHGEVAPTLAADPQSAQKTLAAAGRAGIDLDAVTTELEHAGVKSFCASYHELLNCIESKLGVLAPARGGQSM